jgi:ABC-type Na+ transport system ATPase subunit NatA
VRGRRKWLELKLHRKHFSASKNNRRHFSVSKNNSILYETLTSNSTLKRMTKIYVLYVKSGKSSVTIVSLLAMARAASKKERDSVFPLPLPLDANNL